MDIKPTDQTIKSLFESNFLKVPRFQRPYSWESENVSDFWADTVVSEDLEYFIGSFVVYRPFQGSDTLLIVDGQQRITTITLLLAVIRDQFAELGHRDLAEGVQGMIERRNVNNETQFILQSESPYPYLQEHIQKFGVAELEVDKGAEEEALAAAYEFLRRQVIGSLSAIDSDTGISEAKKKQKKRERLIAIRDKILRLQLILIQLGNEDDAYLIFETINTRGKDLTVADLVKNYLTRLLKPRNRNIDIAKQKWNSILDLFDASEVDIDMSRFLHHSWLSRYPYLAERKLFKEIKRIVDKSNAGSYLDDLVLDAQIYRRILEPDSKWKREEREIKQALDAMNLFRVVQPVPMLLAILRSYGAGYLTLRQVKKIMVQMEHFHVQFTAITAQRTGGGTAHMFALASRSLHNASNKNGAQRVLRDFAGKLHSRLPSRAEFEAGFVEVQYLEEASRQRALVKYLLSQFDARLRRGVVVDYDAMTIEHLAPQNPSGGSSIPAEIVGSMGNLLLIPSKLNESLANKPFAKKREILMSEGVPLDDIIKKATHWGIDEIETRTSSLAAQAQEEIFVV
ncbi:MAG TPA: DUF262 domain-containing HNH endonuclease family protein [Thermoanaerobaculia bacterium]